MSESFVGGIDPAQEAPATDPTADGSSNPAEKAGEPAGSDTPDWLSGLSEDDRGYVGNKGWQDPESLLKSYRHLEEVLGARDGGRGVVLPKDEGDQEAYDKVYEALGRPKAAEDYGLGELMADYPAADPGFMSSMGQAMHKAGLSTRQAHGLAQAFREAEQAIMEQHRREHNEGVAQVAGSFSPEDKRAAKSGFDFLGVSDQEARLIEQFLGVPRAAEVFKKIGRALGEDQAPAGNGAGDPVGSSATAAKEKISALRADPLFSKRFLDGDREAVAQMERLSRIAAGQAAA